jgi:hypothetical protein
MPTCSIDVLNEYVAIETDPQVGQISNSQLRIEVLVIRNQEWIQLQPLLHQVDYEIGVSGSGHGHDAVVLAT